MTANFDVPNYSLMFCVEMSTTVNNSRAHAEPNLNILLLDISPLLPAPLHLRGRIPTEIPEFWVTGKIGPVTENPMISEFDHGMR